jgi:hypothetical protein
MYKGQTEDNGADRQRMRKMYWYLLLENEAK